jgi:hypothetical protein
MKNSFAKTLLLLITFSALYISYAQLPDYTATIYNKQQSKGYYFLFTYSMHFADTTTKGKQLILDNNGQPVYYRTTRRASDFKVHPNGLMSFFGEEQFYLMDKNFRIIDSVSCVNGVKTDAHDFLILPNGDYLLIGTEEQEADLSQQYIFMKHNLPGSAHAKVKAGVVQQLSPAKKLLYQWNARPYFKLEDADKIYLNDTVNIDITHFNSIDMNRKGDFIISARYTNEVIKVCKQTNRLLWRMGGPHNQFSFLNDSIPFLGQHDARFTHNGHITLFDNGYGPENQKHNARALEYKLNEKKKQATLVWSFAHRSTIVSEATGNAQRLKNGNTLLNYGKLSAQSANVTFEEVNRRGQPVIEARFADTLGSYRTFHYKKLPFKLQRPLIEKIKQGQELYLAVKGRYPGYNWNTGETAARIKITRPGTYFVYIPVGDGGFLSSKAVQIKERELK